MVRSTLTGRKEGGKNLITGELEKLRRGGRSPEKEVVLREVAAKKGQSQTEGGTWRKKRK